MYCTVLETCTNLFYVTIKVFVFVLSATLCTNPCKNGGRCKYDVTTDKHLCLCKKEFGGPNCEC